MRSFFVSASILLLTAPSCFATTWTNLIVTRVVDQDDFSPKYFFVERSDRSFAAKVTTDLPLPSVGTMISITGELTNLPLRLITATDITTISPATNPLKSLSMNQESLLTGLRGKAAPTHALLVTVCGKVCRSALNNDPNCAVEWDQANRSYCFYIDDGTGRYGPDFNQSLKVFCNSYDTVIEGQYISVEGVIDTDANFPANNYPVIWPTKPIQFHN